MFTNHLRRVQSLRLSLVLRSRLFVAKNSIELRTVIPIPRSRRLASTGRQKDMGDYKHLDSIFQNITDIAGDNLDYFSDKSKHDFTKTLQTILNVLEPLKISLEVITNCCSKFDVSPSCKGNGYRSIIFIIETCLLKTRDICIQIQRSREKLFFRSYHVYMELESYSQVLVRLLTISHLAIVLLDYSDAGNLFPHDCVVDDMMLDFEKINRECFYGRSFGFQYSDSIRQALQVIGVAMAAYGDGYRHHSHSFSRALSSMLHSGKYMINPELRAQRITELTQNANIDFCKAFWGVTEEYGVQHAPLLICPAMGVNVEFEIPPERLQIKSLNDKDVVTLDFPFLDTKQTGIKCRLISYVQRDGQNNLTKSDSSGYSPLGPKPTQKSRYLMVHCHGGGFVAQSSKSHEMYLRYWAKELQIPILSIDYSLAPKAPYPQAVKEVFYAYVWALKNLSKLGSLGEQICVAGDSAGANLVTALTLQAIQSNIRQPDSIVVAYPPYRLQFLPSPSRILCLMDPLLPVGVLKSCIQAYTGGFPELSSSDSSSFPGKTFSYEPGYYNPYDLDIGQDRGFICRKNMTHSYSETQLNVIKAKYNSDYETCPEENESFCSEFPYTDTESEFEDTFNISKRKNTKGLVEDDYIYFKSTEYTEIETETAETTSSVLQTFTSQVSSKVHDFTSTFAGYFSYQTSSPEDGLTQKYENNLDNKQKNSVPLTALNRKRSLDSQVDLGSLNSFMGEKDKKPNPDTVNEKSANSTFSICKECLNRADQCSCGLPGKATRRRLEKRHSAHYKFSHHHIPNASPQRERSNSMTFDDKENKHAVRKRSTAQCEEEQFGTQNGDELVSSPTYKDKALQNLRLSLLNTTDSALRQEATNSPRSTNSGSSDKVSSPRVVYDPSTESCVILSSAEENKDLDIDSEDPENGTVDEIKLQLGASSKAFQDAKDPLMSPFLADDELLKQIPPIIIVASALDPLLDDSVEFVRKLQKLEKPAELYILDRLPHGFLNFQPFSTEAREGCDLLIACIKKSLQMGMRRMDSTISFTSISSKKSPGSEV